MPSSLLSAIDIPLRVEAGPAVFSPDRIYRYVLRRRLARRGKVANFILLNPSTADETQLDPTLRRCAGFARAWGCAEMVITNVFAYRSTCPKVLRHVAEPIGPENDRHLLKQARSADLVIAGWGNHASHLSRNDAMSRLLKDIPVHCLGVNSTGTPRHPLYVPARTQLIDFECVRTLA